MADIVWACVGGVMIGLAATGLWWTHGRQAGISGILAGLFTPDRAERAWRVPFVLGLLAGGVVLALTAPGVFGVAPDRGAPLLVVSGLLVGYGTRLGGGCTSGHGICGIARVSPRSLAATGTFVAVGVVVATVVGQVLRGGA